MVVALADQLLLGAVPEPGHRPPLAVLVDEGENILQILTAMQVEELGHALRIIAREGVRCDVVDLLVTNPDDAAVVQRLEILLAGAQHGALPAVNPPAQIVLVSAGR